MFFLYVHTGIPGRLQIMESLQTHVANFLACKETVIPKSACVQGRVTSNAEVEGITRKDTNPQGSWMCWLSSQQGSPLQALGSFPRSFMGIFKLVRPLNWMPEPPAQNPKLLVLHRP